MQLLQDRGAIVDYSDPHVPTFPKMRKYQFDLDSVALSPEILQQYDCLLIATDHDSFDYQMIQDNSDIIVDTRGRYKMGTANVVKA